MKEITFYFNIGEIFENRNHGILELTDCYVKNIQRQCRNKYYTKRQKRYIYRCLVCGYIGDISEECLKYQNIGCPACSGRIAVKDKTDMWTTNPKMASMLKNSEDGYIYTEFSNKYTDWICPSCGSIIYHKNISNVRQHGLYCSKCNDNISYPNKFISVLLSKLHIEYFTEHVFDWSKNLIDDPICSKKVYDFYLPKYGIVIEAHGIQHYESCNSTSRSRTLDEEKLNDKIKEQLVLDHNLIYYAIDCRYSDPDFIYSNIIKSGLLDYIGITQDSIDYSLIKFESEKSYVVQCYKMWCEDATLEQLMYKFKKSKNTIQSYIKRGKKIFRESEVKYG